jgi:predicted alpha-1,2-mannosidase
MILPSFPAGRRRGFALGVFFLALTIPLPLPAKTPFQEVSLRIGTANGGQTAPMVGVPFAMTDWTPETQSTQSKCVAPYYFKNSEITGFRGSHWLSGSCARDYGSLTLMPVTGTIQVSPRARASAFRHSTERMNPASYSVFLDRYRERVEMTGTTRTGLLRIQFPHNASGAVLIEPNSRPGVGFVEVRAARQEILGYNPVYRHFIASGSPTGFGGYFVVKFSAPFQSFGTWCGTKVERGKTSQDGGCQRLGAYARFSPSSRPLLVKIGTSFTSFREAALNLKAEQPGWDFGEVEKGAIDAWRAQLDRITIQGAKPDQRQIFYTALYHASLAPRIASNADGTYDGFAEKGELHRIVGSDYYSDFSVWDTFRALHPLLTIVDPLRDQQMIQSLILKGEQGGFLPTFPMFNSYTADMEGDHADAIIADAYQKGLRHFDVQQAYRLMLQNATTCPPAAEYRLGLGRRGLRSYLRYGYIPLEDPVSHAFHQGEQVSRTLAYAYDDSLVAMMARHLGYLKEAAALRERSENWRHVFDPAVGFVRGRHANGSWVKPFDPTKNASYLAEGNPWQYTFFVPEDIPGLIRAMGGKANFIRKLDGLFANHLYDQGNEPSHQIAYLYDYAGAPSDTQKRVRTLLESDYHDDPGGLPGNDDAGQMSAWYIFSAMGFYPVTPGSPFYAIGSPLFPKVTIHEADGRKFVIVAIHQKVSHPYIQSQELNGHRLTSFLLPHAAIVKGGTLKLIMGGSAHQFAH